MKIIAGNWKMNGTRTALAEMLDAIAGVTTENRVILCVPFTMLRNGTDNVAIGAQDVSANVRGAYTGEVSGAMIAETGAKYVIVGHSERRMYHDETNDIVRAKAMRAIENGLTPIICVGETMEEKRAGKTFDIITDGVRESVPENVTDDIIIAYEPRWAIGAGITPTAQEIADAHKVIADTLGYMGLNGTPILYGASVNANNVADIVAIKNVDGVLVGGASLKPQEFVPIINNAK
ncbi:MAG: triose-phosphate isomerase [Alphaproteobacteria bacterium]|jgi:triosephosphate isomerase|nr:triose-phosphate isomerase [Alphaproteobacteria bacterium]